MAGIQTLSFTDQTFENEVLKSDVPVLVDFWAEWCPPCRQMISTVDVVATEYAGKAKVGKLNVDDNQNTASRYGIRSIPAFLVFSKGQVVGQRVGAMSKGDVQKMLDSVLQPA